MEPDASKEENAKVGNACHIARHRVYNHACAILNKMLVKGNISPSTLVHLITATNYNLQFICYSIYRLNILIFSRCCKKNLNSTCFPILETHGETKKPDRLPDGTPCYQGFCNKVHVCYDLNMTM